MGSDDSILLNTNDLVGFNNSVIGNSTPYIVSQGLANFQPNMSTWSPAAQGITSFGKAFLEGFLRNQARADAAEQLNSVVNILPQLRSDPYNVSAPEGVDANAFGLLKGSAIMRNAALDETKKARVSTLLQSVLGDAVKNRQIGVNQAVQIASSNDPVSAISSFASAPKETSTPAAPIDNPLANGRDSSSKKIQGYYQQYLDAGMPPVQAASAAKEQLAGEVKANNKSFDEAKAARDYGQNLLTMANSARAGIEKAGETGPFNTLAKGYEYVARALGSKEAAEQIAGDTTLDSIAPDIIKMARPLGGGATSDFEARTYLGSGPSTRNTPEANAILVQKLENLGQLNIDYADFLEAYREANSGSIVGAGKKWNEYKSAFPIFKNGEINTDRPSWQEYFSAIGSGESLPATTAPVQTDTGKYSESDLKAAGYSNSDIAALRLQGVVR